MESIYNFNLRTITNEETTLSKYKNKVLLIVNLASKCGFTPQYKELESLYKKHKDDGLVILGFPCNQFGNQETGNNKQILEFCKMNYNTTFPLFSKIDVNGKNAHPLYKFLKSEKSGFLGTKSIKWNFTKFLLDKNGNILERFSPSTSPLSFEDKIQKLLKKDAV